MAAASAEPDNIARLLTAQARARPDATALVEFRRGGPRRCTFAELEARSARVARRMKEAGLGPGDTALVFLPVSIDLYEVLVALFRLGVAAMFVDPFAGYQAVKRCCALLSPKAFVASRMFFLAGLVSPTIRQIPVRLSVPPGGLGAGCAPLPEIAPLGRDAPALVTFTSGSTGVPKGVARSHGDLLAQYRAITRAVPLDAGDADLTMLPVVVLANLASGVTTLLPPKAKRRPSARDAAAWIEIAAREPATTLTARPMAMGRMVAHCRATGRTLPALKRAVVGGDPVPIDLLTDLRAVAPDADVVAVYGATEAEPIAAIRLDDMADTDLAAMRAGQGQLVGRPVDGTKVAILLERWGRPIGPFAPEAFAAEALPPGEVGEVAVSGDHVVAGYLDASTDGATKVRVGDAVWHRTGDLARFDGRGRLWLTGRCAPRP